MTEIDCGEILRTMLGGTVVARLILMPDATASAPLIIRCGP
jgi:hypothetical protein